MKRILIGILLVLPLLVPAAEKEPSLIPLDRGKTNDTKRGDKQRQTLRDQKKRAGSPVQDRPAADRSALKLPTAIINIEDMSSMDVRRGHGTGSLIPTIDRTNRVKDGQPGDFRDRTNGKDGNGKDVPGGRKGDVRTLSQMEILYGSFHSLSAFVMTGLERKIFSYQVSFGVTVMRGSTKTGIAFPVLPRVVMISFSTLVGAVTVLQAVSVSVFSEQTTGLQSNTNFSQLRNTGVKLDWKGSYIFSSAGSLKFSLGFLGLRYVLDNPVSQETVSTYGGSLSIGADFNWASRSFLKLRTSMFLQNADANVAADSEIIDPVVSAVGGFGLGPFIVSLGMAMHVPGMDTVQLAPHGKIQVHFGKGFFLYALVERKIRWLDQERMLSSAPYAGYTSIEDPEDSWRFGGGGKVKLGAFVLNFSLFYVDYSRLYVPTLLSNDLYGYVSAKPGLLELTGEARVFLYKSLSLRLRYVQRILDETVPYLPELLFSTALEFRVPKLGTVVSATGRFEGNRNDGSLDPYFLLDLAFRQPIIKGLSAVLVLRNLLDADYRQREFYAEPGFSLHAGMSLRF